MRRLTRTTLPVVAVVSILALGCATTPPDRIAYTTIDQAVNAVQTAMRAFNDLYQQGKLTDADRLRALDAYAKFQAVAKSAVVIAQSATGPNPDVSRVITDAALEALKVLQAFTGGR